MILLTLFIFILYILYGNFDSKKDIKIRIVGTYNLARNGFICDEIARAINKFDIK
tara:strand:- start:32 stop:196 length:165 start_codon:yes stop_codon:yes gene_type:complete